MISMPLRHQTGATLVIALIMLVLLTLFALTAMNASNTNLKIASNAQTRAETTAAVQQEIDKIMSVDFTTNPTGFAGNKAVDINGDGATDYNVVIFGRVNGVDTVAPACISSIPIKTAELDIAKPSDVACFGSGTSATSGIITGGKAGGSSGNSLCSNSQWDIGGRATDPVSGATTTIHQGTTVRVAIGSPC